MSPRPAEELTDREREVLLAVIDSFVRSANPAGSRKIARSYDLGVSPATVRNTMADLEGKGFLVQPHTSAGRMPTDRAYRYYVDRLMGRRRPSPRLRRRIESELVVAEASAIEELVARAARALGLVTGELGLAVGPTLSEAVLQKLELVPISSQKVLLVLTLESGVVRTVYVDLTTELPRPTLVAVAEALNERLAGSRLEEIRRSLAERLRDLPLDDPAAGPLLNIFVESGPEIFDWASGSIDLHLGQASLLADQPEFETGERLRALLELTERRELLAAMLGTRADAGGPQITIGAEHDDPELADLTVVTANYAAGNLRGVVGVIGPTRMPYEKVIAIVDYTSSVLTRLISP